jgi:hypothetical protein
VVNFKHDFSLDKLTSNLALHLRKVTEVFELVRKLFSFRLLHFGFAVNDSVYFLKALGPVSSAMVE